MKYYAYLSKSTPNGDEPESEFRASNPDRLREFIEAYWLNMKIPEGTWEKMLEGWPFIFPQDGTIHIEIEG